MIFNSRANIINNGVTTSCIACCILDGYDNITCRNIITRSTINISCESTIWAFNHFSAISFSVNSWSYSIYSVSFLASSSIRCYSYVNIFATFNDCAKTSDYILASIIDVGKIVFSNAFNNSFFTCYQVTITICIRHSNIAIVIYCILIACSCCCNVFFIFKISNFMNCSTTIVSVCNAVAIFLNDSFTSTTRIFQRNFFSNCFTSCYAVKIFKVFIKSKCNRSITVTIVSLVYSQVFTCLHCYCFTISNVLSCIGTCCNSTFCARHFIGSDVPSGCCTSSCIYM